MSAGRYFTAIVLVCCMGSWVWAGEQVRYYEKGGITYRETRRVVREPVWETRTQQSTRTVYRQQAVTELRDTICERLTPVTEYRWEAVWIGRWNPFTQPYLAYRYAPRTHWERSTETVKTPVVSRRLVPETQTVRLPVTTQRIVEKEVISRVAVSNTPTPALPWSQPASTARLVPVVGTSGPIGGVARLENDPPRQGTATAWRASTNARR